MDETSTKVIKTEEEKDGEEKQVYGKMDERKKKVAEVAEEEI